MFTGKLEGISRAEAKSLIEENSGSIISNVSKKLNYLVIGNKPTNRKIQSGISGSQDAFKRLKDEAQTLGQKAPTQFSKVQEAFQSLANETRSVGDSNVVADQVDGSVEEATRLVAVFKKLGKDIYIKK